MIEYFYFGKGPGVFYDLVELRLNVSNIGEKHFTKRIEHVTWHC